MTKTHAAPFHDERPPDAAPVAAGGALADELRALKPTLSPPLADARSTANEPHSGAAIQLSVHADLEELRETWKTFERRADRTAFQSFGWLLAWHRHIGARRGSVPVIVLGRDGEGELLFILPLAIERHALARRLTFMGSDLCDYNVPLIAKHFSARMSAQRFVPAWRQVIALIRSDPRFAFDLIDLQKMPETIGAQRNPFLELPVRMHPSGAYVAELGGDWEQFYAANRSAPTRKRERRQLRQLAEHGRVQFVEIEAGAAAAQTVAALIDQKSRAFARMGVEDIFARKGYREFLLAVTSEPQLRELVHVSRLDIGSTMAAINIGLQFRDSYYLIFSSYAESAAARHGPGRAHLNELLRRAIERGFTRFDFTVGDEPYKRDWVESETCLYDHLAPVTLRGAAVAAGATVFRQAKRAIKRSPKAWTVFCRARSLAGAVKVG